MITDHRICCYDGFMIRTQIQLTEEQSEGLKRLATEAGISMAELVRQAVDRLLASGGAPDRDEIARRSLALIGTFSSGIPDLAEEHDRYLAEGLEDWRSS